MNTMRRFGLAALCVVAMALVAGTSAPAIAADVIPMRPTGAEPNASGFAQTKTIRRPTYTREAQVICQGLTPGARYYAHIGWWETNYRRVSFPLADFVADKNGSGRTHWERYGWAGNVFFFVYRDDGAGSAVMVLISD